MIQNKWAQTGWRPEQKYANKVLLGNWAEERLQVGFLSSCCHFFFYPHTGVTLANLNSPVRKAAILRCSV